MMTPSELRKAAGAKPGTCVTIVAEWNGRSAHIVLLQNDVMYSNGWEVARLQYPPTKIIELEEHDDLGYFAIQRLYKQFRTKHH